MRESAPTPRFEVLPVEEATHLLLVLGFEELAPVEQINPPVEVKRDALRPEAEQESE